MRSGIKWVGNAHTVTMDRCPCCGAWCQAQIRGRQLLGLKHATFEQDMACPYIQRQDANPVNRFQKVVFNYADLEDRGIAAREALRRTELRESRLDGRRGSTTAADTTEDLL